MRGMIRGAAPAGLLAAILAAGCSVGAPGPHQATVDTCYAFGVRALERHITVRTVPRACSGLSHAQINLAVARAVRETVGARHKAVARRLAYREGAYLAHLITTVPAPRPAPPVAPAGQSSDLAVSLGALAAWIATAAAGSYLLAGWLAGGGLRRRARATDMPPAVIVGHFALAVTGLGTWIAFVATGEPVLAWIAAGLILPATGLGMATLAAALSQPAASPGSASPPAASPGSASPGSASPGPASAGPASAGPASPGPPPEMPTAAAAAEVAAPARAAMPVIVIAVHGALATATILLVLLAAIGAA
jgi:hypothetical protein